MDKKTKISIIRGAFLNPFELQNFSPLKEEHDLVGYSSLKPISDSVDLPLVKLFSPTDLPIPFVKYQVLNRLFSDAHYLFGLEKRIVGSDIVHVAETYYHYTHQALVAKKKGLVGKVVSTVWEVIPHNNESLRGRKKFKQQALREVDHFIAVTNKAKNALLIEGVGEKKITVIPMGINLDNFHPIKTKKRKRNINILFAGRLVEEKGVKDLIQAFLLLKEKKLPIKLTVVGRGALKKDLVGIKGVNLTQSSYQHMPRVYPRADIFCLPSRVTPTWQEQYGMVLIEAMASGLPIVTTRTGAIEEVCGSAALYAPQKSPQQLAAILEKLINQPSLRKDLSSQSLKRARQHYDHRLVADRIKTVYQQLL